MKAALSTDLQSAPLPEGFFPEGMTQTSFDDDLLFLIEHAIPPSIGGKRVFAHLLSYATLNPTSTIQRSLFQSISEYGDEAIVLIKSVEALAKSKDSPCAPETYHKVLLAFEAMHILRRRFHRDFTEIRIPLGKRTLHIPTLLQGLQAMYKKHRNAKFQRFALRVAARLRSSEFAAFDLPHDLAPAHQPIAQVLLGLLEQHNVKEVRIPSLHEACKLLVQALQSERVDAKTSELVGDQPTIAREKGQKLGESIKDSPEDQKTAHEQQGEFRDTNSPHIPISWAIKSKQKGKTRLFHLKKGEAEAIFTTNSPEFADLGYLSANLGESVACVSLSDQNMVKTLTCNGETAINDTTPTDSPIYKDPRPIEEIRYDATNLAERLDGSRKSRWLAKLITCVKYYPEHVRRLAEIDTLYHSAFPDYRGKPQVPGAWFAKRCEDYANPAHKIKAEIREWDRSQLDLVTIHQGLQRGLQIPVARFLLCGAAEQLKDAFPSVPSQQEKREAIQHSLLNTRMDLDQARALCTQIRQHVQEFCVQMHALGQEVEIEAEVYEDEHTGEYVVVTTWDGCEEEWTNAAKWNRYFANMKECYLS